MNQGLIYFMDELCAGIEIYFTGRTGGQYLKTAFILCDDYTELASKLYLLTANPTWSDQNAPGRFKNYHDVMDDVKDLVKSTMAAQLRTIELFQISMKRRRGRRNDFFHSTSLLDLNVTQRNCVEAFCDLLEYGEILLGSDWRAALENARNLGTYEILLHLERRAFSDPSITPQVNKILQEWPRNTSNTSRKGVHLAEYPEDLHLRLCVTCGERPLRDKLRTL